MRDPRTLPWWGLVAILLMGCDVALNIDDQRYACATTRDCGPGYVCGPAPDLPGVMVCLPVDMVIDGLSDQDIGDLEPGDARSDDDTPAEVEVSPTCGDGALDDGETCDDGNAVDEDACTSACQPNVCGDGHLYDGVEACDDGNTETGDGCTAACELGATFTTLAGMASSPSLAIGGDGLPVIAYYDTDSQDLKVIKCDDAACTASRTSTVDSAGDVGRHADLTLAFDDKPIIAYRDATNDVLKIAKCSDQACEAFTLQETGTMGGLAPSIFASPTRSPLIACLSGLSANILKIVRCGDSYCNTSFDELLVNPDITVEGQSALIAREDPVSPILAYYDALNQDLKLAVCSDDTCSSISEQRTLDDTSDVGRYAAAGLVADLPFIAYYDQTNGDLKAVRCGDPSCDPTDAGFAQHVIDAEGDVGRDVALAVGPDALSVIAYRDLTEGALKVARCDDASCTSARIEVVDAIDNAGEAPSIAIGADGVPIIAYLNQQNVLKIAYLDAP